MMHACIKSPRGYVKAGTKAASGYCQKCVLSAPRDVSRRPREVIGKVRLDCSSPGRAFKKDALAAVAIEIEGPRSAKN